MFLNRKFAGHFSTITDTRSVRDPWGLGIALEVLRADHAKWAEREGKRTGGATELVLRTSLKATIASGMSDQEPERRGFRRARRLTRAEAAARVSRVRPVDVVSEAIDQVSGSELLATLVSSDLNRDKPDVARILLVGWSGVLDDDGRPVECTLAARLGLLGWHGVLVEIPGGVGGEFGPHAGPHFYHGDDWAKVDAKDPVSRAVAAQLATKVVCDGNPRDEGGNLLIVPDGPPDAEPVPYAGELVGDAFTLWVLDAAEDAAAFRAQHVEATAGNSPTTPGGEPAT